MGTENGATRSANSVALSRSVKTVTLGHRNSTRNYYLSENEEKHGSLQSHVCKVHGSVVYNVQKGETIPDLMIVK